MICFITLGYVTEKIFFSSFYVLPQNSFFRFFLPRIIVSVKAPFSLCVHSSFGKFIKMEAQYNNPLLAELAREIL
jgi:hypothetical protein